MSLDELDYPHFDEPARAEADRLCRICEGQPVEPGSHVCANNRCQSEGATR